MNTLELQRWTCRGTINSDGARTSCPLWAQGFRDGRASDETDVVAVSTRKADGTSARRFLDRAGFTLIELLVVIAVIGVLAALIVTILPAALGKSKRAGAVAQLRALEQAIQGYQSDKGYYPPDNVTDPGRPPLAFELLGCRRGPGVFVTPMGHSIADGDLLPAFGVAGFANVEDPAKETTSRNYFPEVKPGIIQPKGNGFYFSVPIKGTNGEPNLWFYNSSSPLHNKKSFDLWATIEVGNRRYVISNWDSP